MREIYNPAFGEVMAKAPEAAADADFEAAIDGALFGMFFNQGEVCSAGSRVLVEKRIYKNFVEAMVEKAKRIKLGNGMERSTTMGPLVSAEQRERVERYVAIGKQEGGKILLGGKRPGGELAKDGMEAYLQAKQVHINLNPNPLGWY